MVGEQNIGGKEEGCWGLECGVPPIWGWGGGGSYGVEFNAVACSMCVMRHDAVQASNLYYEEGRRQCSVKGESSVIRSG